MRSAPKKISAVADALEWVLLTQGVTFSLHYLDDFLTIGSPGSGERANNLALIETICRSLGIPLKSEKIAGPAMVLEFLGILLDTEAMELRLPEPKVAELKHLMEIWANRRAYAENGNYSR